MTPCALARARHAVRLLFTEERESMRCIKPRPPSRLLAPLYSATHTHTHAMLVSPIPLPYVTPYSPPRLPTRLLLFLRLLILPTLQLSAGEKLYSPLEKWPLVECATELAAVRIGALASPREIVTSNKANLRARGSEGRKGERERRVTLEGCSAHGLGIIQRLRWRHNDRSPR